MSYWTDDRSLLLSQRRLDAQQQEALERKRSQRKLDSFPCPPDACPWHVGGAFAPDRCRNCGEPIETQE